MGDHPVFPRRGLNNPVEVYDSPGSPNSRSPEIPGIYPGYPQTGVYAHTVDKVIGSAYDTVRYVAENLEYIKHVSAHLEQIFILAGMTDVLDVLAAHVAEMEAIYANMSSIVAVAAIDDEIVDLANHLPQLMAIHAELEKFLELYAHLDAFVFIYDNRDAVLAVGENIDAVTAVADNIEELKAIYESLDEILALVSNFDTRDALKDYITQYPINTSNRIFVAGGYQYITQPGVSYITDLPGLVPYGLVHVEHFGAKADMISKLYKLGLVGSDSEYGPYRFAGTDDYNAFRAADDYVTDVLKTGTFYAEAGGIEDVNGDPNVKEMYRGYYIGQMFILKGKLRSRRDYRNYIWLHNKDVHGCNIWINSSNGGVVGLSLIGQYDYSSSITSKPSGQGQCGPIITVLTATASSVGANEYPRLYTPERQAILRDIEIDVRTCRAGITPSRTWDKVVIPPPPGGLGYQVSNGAYHLLVASGCEFSSFTILPFSQTNAASNGLALAHYGCKTNGIDPWLNWAGVVVEEQYACTDCKWRFPGFIDEIARPHGMPGVFYTAGSGALDVGDISCRGLAPVTFTIGDPGNEPANTQQKDKMEKGISVGYVTTIDCPMSNGYWNATTGKYEADKYGTPQNTVIKVSGLGATQHDFDRYDNSQRLKVRQVDVDVKFKGMYIARHLRTNPPNNANGDPAPPIYAPNVTEAWNARAMYIVGCLGTVDTGAMTTWGYGRAVEIEYSDGCQIIDYMEGDGTLMYEFSRGGRFIQSDVNKIVPGYVEDPRHGGYRPGDGPGTRAISIAGKRFSTEVNMVAGGKILKGSTRTPIIAFGEQDEDLIDEAIAQPTIYIGTPIKIGNQGVTSTNLIVGRSSFNYPVIEIQPGNPAKIYISALDGVRMFNGMNVTLVDQQALRDPPIHPDDIVPAINVTGTLVNVDQGTGAHMLKGAPRGYFEIAGFSYVNPAGTPNRYVQVRAVLPGVDYIDHTPLPEDVNIPTDGTKVTVTVDETVRINELNLNSTGSESAVVAQRASIDGLTMYGLKSAAVNGLKLVETRCSVRGPMPITVGTKSMVAPIGQPGHVAKYSVRGDAASLVSFVDSTILDNPNVDAHFLMEKLPTPPPGTPGGGGGHVDLRNCRIENLDKIMLGSQGTRRFALTMYACTDYQYDRPISHPGRQGQDEDQTVGGKGYYHYNDDGKLECWIRNQPTSDGTAAFPDPFTGEPMPVGTYTWKFPANFSAGAATVTVEATPGISSASSIFVSVGAPESDRIVINTKRSQEPVAGTLQGSNPARITFSSTSMFRFVEGMSVVVSGATAGFAPANGVHKITRVGVGVNDIGLVGLDLSSQSGAGTQPVTVLPLAPAYLAQGNFFAKATGRWINE